MQSSKILCLQIFRPIKLTWTQIDLEMLNQANQSSTCFTMVFILFFLKSCYIVYLLYITISLYYYPWALCRSFIAIWKKCYIHICVWWDWRSITGQVQYGFHVTMLIWREYSFYVTVWTVFCFCLVYLCLWRMYICDCALSGADVQDKFSSRDNKVYPCPWAIQVSIGQLCYQHWQYIHGCQ